MLCKKGGLIMKKDWWFRYVQEHFQLGNYDQKAVKVFTKKKKITPLEYKKITGERYSP